MRYEHVDMQLLEISSLSLVVVVTFSQQARFVFVAYVRAETFQVRDEREWYGGISVWCGGVDVENIYTRIDDSMSRLDSTVRTHVSLDSGYYNHS